MLVMNRYAQDVQFHLRCRLAYSHFHFLEYLGSLLISWHEGESPGSNEARLIDCDRPLSRVPDHSDSNPHS